MEEQDVKKKKKIVAIVTAVLVVAFFAALTYFVGRPLLEFVSEPEKFREWVDSYGFLGVLAFIGINMVQVFLAIIPGGPFEIAAGYAFGVVKGTLICDFAMTSASVIIFAFVKKFGMKFVEIFADREKVENLSFLQNNSKSKAFMFFFYLIPGLPKDLMCYAAGLTKLSIPYFAFINAVGRFPAILMSAIGGNAVGEQKYTIFIIIMAVIIVAYIVGSIAYKKITDAHKKSENVNSADVDGNTDSADEKQENDVDGNIHSIDKKQENDM